MFISKKHLTRRTVLRGAGTALALPLIDPRKRRRFRAWIEGECACEDDVRTLEPSQDRGDLQSVCACDAWRVLAR